MLCLHAWVCIMKLMGLILRRLTVGFYEIPHLLSSSGLVHFKHSISIATKLHVKETLQFSAYENNAQIMLFTKNTWS